MKLNSETQIIGLKTILVPYRIMHVEKYHKWMESEELRKLTASERLNLEEEYEMQQTWLRDEEKCTFIVLAKDLMEQRQNEVEAMIGDANLYLREDGTAEVGLMIAEQGFRNEGRGREAALHLLRYGIENIGIKKYVAIISMDNTRSINFFTSLKFYKDSESKFFQEVTLCRPVDIEWQRWLEDKTHNYIIGTTEPNK